MHKLLQVKRQLALTKLANKKHGDVAKHRISEASEAELESLEDSAKELQQQLGSFSQLAAIPADKVKERADKLCRKHAALQHKQADMRTANQTQVGSLTMSVRKLLVLIGSTHLCSF